MRLRPKKPAPANAARLLPRLAEKFFQAGDKSTDEALKAEDLHAFRILTKRLRYALEYFRACYGGAMDSYIQSVRDLQHILGDLTDCWSTRVFCERVLQVGNRPSRYVKLFAALETREQELVEKYRDHWRRTFDRPAVRQKFLRYLSRPLAGKSSAPRPAGAEAPAA